MPDSPSPETLAANLGEALVRRELMLVAAESCTGGGLARAATEVPGSSRWFDRGFVAYSFEARCEMLGVDRALLDEHGTVSEAAVLAMAEGALAASRADLAVAISGVAGPGGGTPEKPVGLVWMAWQLRGMPGTARSYRFDGDRAAIRLQSVCAGLAGAIEALG